MRLRYAYFIKCVDVVKDASRRGGGAALHLRPRHARRRRARRAQGQGHDALGVGGSTPLPAEVRLYDRLFTKADPDDGAEGEDFTDYINPDSLEVLTGCLRGAEPGGGRAGQHASSSSARATSASTRIRQAGRAGVQPHGVAEKRL